MIETLDRDGVVIVRLDHGKVNAIDAELMEGVRATLAELVPADAAAVVLTGKAQVFSAGVDLFRVLEGGAGYLSDFLPVLSDALREIFEFPKPLVAAVNGHAVAGGCILACACDYRVMAEASGRVGVPELRVGVPFPAVPLEIVRHVVPNRFLQEVILLGRTYEPAGALERGLIDEVVPVEVLEDRALSVARDLASIGADAYRLSKEQLRRPCLDRMDLTAEFYDAEVERLWKADASHQAIRDYLDRTVGRRR